MVVHCYFFDEYGESSIEDSYMKDKKINEEQERLLSYLRESKYSTFFIIFIFDKQTIEWYYPRDNLHYEFKYI